MNWRVVKKAIIAFIGALATAIGTVAAAKHGDPLTEQDWITVVVILLGTVGTTAGVWKAKNATNGGTASSN